MTDIVERLKSGDFYQREGFDAAAAEITALREKLEGAERDRDEAKELAFSEHKNEIRAIDAAKAAESRADTLQARVERLEEALRPFAKVGEFMKRTPATTSVRLGFLAVESGGMDTHGSATMLVADFLSARAALAADGENNDRD